MELVSLCGWSFATEIYKSLVEQIQLRQFRIQLQRFFQLGFRNTNDLPLLWDFPETSHARKFQNYTRRPESHKHLYKGIPQSLQRDCTRVDTWVDRFQVSNASAFIASVESGKINKFSKHHQAFCRQQPEPERDFKTKTFHCFFTFWHKTRLLRALTTTSHVKRLLRIFCYTSIHLQTSTQNPDWKKGQQVLLPGNFGFSVCNVLTTDLCEWKQVKQDYNFKGFRQQSATDGGNIV